MSTSRHPKLYETVLQAVLRLGEVKGSSVRNILDVVRSAINDKDVRPRPKNVSALVRHALTHGVVMGHLQQRSGRYKIRVNSSRVEEAISGPQFYSRPGTSRPNTFRNPCPLCANCECRYDQSNGQGMCPYFETEHEPRYHTRSHTARLLAAQKYQEDRLPKALLSSRSRRSGRQEKQRARRAKKPSGKSSGSKRVKGHTKHYRQKEPTTRKRRRGTPHPLVDNPEYQWTRANPFVLNLDWGVEEDNNDDDPSTPDALERRDFDDRTDQQADNPEPLFEPRENSEDLSPDSRELMADENRPDSDKSFKEEDNADDDDEDERPLERKESQPNFERHCEDRHE